MAEDPKPPMFPSVIKPVEEDSVKTVEEPVKEELEYQKILREYGGIESNIPINSPYWRLRP